MISPGQANTVEYFVPRSVSDFNLPALSETSLNNASSTIIPPPPLVDGSVGPLPALVGGGRLCNTTPRRMPSEQRVVGVGREKMVTFEDDLTPNRDDLKASQAVTKAIDWKKRC
ncbi:Hypothetical predicted protein [Cloeon dipterum]|uniref:Uncharacterized protein n=1 Tax=Cloeon dipterum TaxID=197152 RepID=A0A8S1CW89_9INSE|nr:Hypothetical predicted protein [Cloeon dipterum]